MAGVVVDLGTLVTAEGVFDGELVEVELGGELGHLLVRRVAQVDPDQRALARDVIGHVGDREPLGLQLTLVVDPCVRHARTPINCCVPHDDRPATLEEATLGVVGGQASAAA